MMGPLNVFCTERRQGHAFAPLARENDVSDT